MLPQISLMKVEEVVNYLSNEAKVTKNITGLDFYSSIELVKPYQEIEQRHKFVKVADLATVLSADLIREMETKVNTLVDEERWYFPIADYLK